MTVQKRNDAMVNLLRADFQGRYEPQFALANLHSTYISLAGLRGLWIMSNPDENGDLYDLTGQGRTLTYAGNPTYNFDSLAPYLDFDGTGDYLTRTDEAGLDILGTETTIASAIRGLTLGGWFWLDVLPSAFTGLAGKSVFAGNQRAYALILNAANVFRFFISQDGITAEATGITTAQTGQWYNIVGRFTPSSEIAIFVNGVKETGATAIASLFNSTAAFEVFRINASPVLDGRTSVAFLCAAALSDSIITNQFHQTKAMFNVT